MISKKAERVEANDHLLTEILSFLPPKSVFRFLVVSKRWNNMIKHPFFFDLYTNNRNHRRLLAFFKKKAVVDLWDTIEKRTNAPPMKILPARNSIIDNKVPREIGYFINSSNGLVLCYRPGKNLYVFNPVTKNRVKLPLPPPESPTNGSMLFTSLGLMCHQNKVNNLNSSLSAGYIVVQPYVKTNGYKLENVLEIGTYSSERPGEWDYSQLVGTGCFDLDEQLPVVANGVFHWFTRHESIAVYDPNDGQNHLQLIVLPKWMMSIKSNVRYNVIAPRSSALMRSSGGDDILWYGASTIMNYHDIRFWMLPKDEGVIGSRYKRSTTIPFEEWVLMYEISVESLPTITPRRGRGNNPEICLDAFVSWDPLIVLLRSNETWFLVDVETMAYELAGFDHIEVDSFSCRLSPFFESSLLSSYAFLSRL